jgi:glycosyltransferase involved in cell wall biosynthesis
MKLQILVPQYTETEEVIKPLLDSIQIQQGVDLTDVGVIIVNDGTDVYLSREFLDRYTYRIDYYLHEHKGVSATRNACLDYATADYVMFCDADDMFYNACGLYIIFQEIARGDFDTFVSKFIEEVRHKITNEPIYINHDIDSTFVHGKVHRRQYLIDNNIRWKEDLTLHEDGYFNSLCQRLTGSVKYCSTPFYLWRWRDDSVCRSDKQWVMKTYDHFITANDYLIEEFLKRDREDAAQFYIALLLLDVYFTLNKYEWDSIEENYRKHVETRFREYYNKYKELYLNMTAEVKSKLSDTIQLRLRVESSLIKNITFEDWIEKILSEKD